MELHSLTTQKGLTGTRRVGRGGKRGKTSGRGGKGQTARAGNKPRPEMRDRIKKIPKRRGYGKNRSATVVPRVPAAPISLNRLSGFVEGETVSPRTLVAKGVVRRGSGKLPTVKILGVGALATKLIFEKVSFSASARALVEKSGSTIN